VCFAALYTSSVAATTAPVRPVTTGNHVLLPLPLPLPLLLLKWLLSVALSIAVIAAVPGSGSVTTAK
jgi:hypothetical protein